MAYKPAVSLALIGLAACIHPTPTPAIVAHMLPAGTGQAFRGCIVNVAWTQEELLENCGQPDLGFVPWINHPGSNCALYRTSAKSFAAGMGADVLAVCLTRAAPGAGGAESKVRVWEVYGLDAAAIQERR